MACKKQGVLYRLLPREPRKSNNAFLHGQHVDATCAEEIASFLSLLSN
jgi:hypothetical protein